MNERWVCRQCFADNEGDADACHRCGLARFAGAGDRTDAATADPADPQAGAADGSVPPWQPAAPPTRPFWQRLLSFWWVGLIAAVFVGGMLFNARRDESGQINDGGTLSVTDLRVGDCFNTEQAEEIGDVDAVPCAEPHAYELFHVFDYPDQATYPTDAEWGAESERVCGPAFATYVGVAYDDSELYASPLTPTESGWDEGDREVQCILHNRTETAMTGSQRGTAH